MDKLGKRKGHRTWTLILPFAHPKASSGYTLSSKDESIRKFWVQHAIKSREIASVMGKETGQPCINNIWIPDGSKDFPVQRYEHRKS